MSARSPEEYEEKLMNFSINNDELRHLLDNIFEIALEGQVTSFEDMSKALAERGLEKTADKLLEFKMLRQQNPNDLRMRENIDLRIIESQLQQLDAEIKDCLRQLQNSESFSEEVYKRYESLKKARESLISSQDFD